MVTVILSLDYEIHGNGEGNPLELMVVPTDRLIRLLDRYGAKVTIMADIGEILKFKEYADSRGTDRFHYEAIADQLRRAVRAGHDVQLHIHSSYFNATHDGRRWLQDWAEYSFADLGPARMTQMIRTGKEFLESLLQPVKPAYRCSVFRAANWSVSPSQNIVRALYENGIYIDSSVFKYGVRRGMVSFNYESAPSEMLPWRADASALWRGDPDGAIWEVPIYSERRHAAAFLSPNRLYRAVVGRFHRVPRARAEAPGRAVCASGSSASHSRALVHMGGWHAWKADFNQCTGAQLIRALKRAAGRHRPDERPTPFVLIGHSKLFTAWNVRSLRPFLAFVAANGDRFSWGTYESLGLTPLHHDAPEVLSLPNPQRPSPPR